MLLDYGVLRNALRSCGLPSAVEPPGGRVAAANRVDDSIRGQSPECGNRLVKRRTAVVDVRVLQVDLLDTEPTETALDRRIYRR